MRFLGGLLALAGTAVLAGAAAAEVLPPVPPVPTVPDHRPIDPAQSVAGPCALAFAGPGSLSSQRAVHAGPAADDSEAAGSGWVGSSDDNRSVTVASRRGVPLRRKPRRPVFEHFAQR
jgi:hypothetical protein